MIMEKRPEIVCSKIVSEVLFPLSVIHCFLYLVVFVYVFDVWYMYIINTS